MGKTNKMLRNFILIGLCASLYSSKKIAISHLPDLSKNIRTQLLSDMAGYTGSGNYQVMGFMNNQTTYSTLLSLP